jgi:allophanate hydrolase
VGCHVAEADISALLEAATLLYGGSFVAERHAAVGEHIAAHEDLIGDTLDPVVATIIADGAKHSASSYFADRARLDHLAAQAATALAGFDALLTPTTTGHPTFEEVRADPVGANARLGRYTNFCNLLDLAALAVPAGTAASGPFGIMLTGPAGSDDWLASLAALHDPPSTELLVVGAHLSGQPLNHELLLAGGVLLGSVSTAPQYRLYALDTVPPKPGLVRVPAPAASGPRGAAIAGELWQLQATGLARFMAGLAAPMAIGRVRLADGREVLGFLCESAALDGAADITDYGGWRAYRERG